MWPILVIMIVVWAITIERIVYLKKAGIDKEKLLALLKSQIMAGNIQGAIKVCSGNPTPMTRIIQAGLTKFNRPDARSSGGDGRGGAPRDARASRSAPATSPCSATSRRSSASSAPSSASSTRSPASPASIRR